MKKNPPSLFKRLANAASKLNPQRDASTEFPTLRDLFIHQLQDLYSAENQLVDALPKMAEGAHNPKLKKAINAHLRETRQQVKRLSRIGRQLKIDLSGETCKATKGLVAEASEWLGESANSAVMDAGIIADAQRVEHYEISGYGTAITHAKLLGENEAAATLAATLKEEKAADKKLTSIAKTINRAALMHSKSHASRR